MNSNRIEGSWKQFMGSVKVWWSEVTEARLDRVAGEREQQAGRVQEADGAEQEAREARDARGRGGASQDPR